MRLIAAAVLLKKTGVYVGKWTGHHVCIQTRNTLSAKQTSTAQTWMAQTPLAQSMRIVVKDILVIPALVPTTKQKQMLAVPLVDLWTVLVGLAAIQAASHAVAPVAERDRVAQPIAVREQSWQIHLRNYAIQITPPLA